MFSRILIAAIFTMSFLTLSYVQAFDNTVSADQFNDMYEAPKTVKTEKPQRVFYSPNREVEGYVTLAMLVDEDGQVEKVKVLYRTSTLAVNNAVSAAENWEFEPATVNGQPVKAWVAYNMPFGQDLEIYENTRFTQSIVADETTLALLK